MEKLREYMIKKYLEAYYSGVSAALAEIAKIHCATDEELVQLAEDRGVQVDEWVKQ